MNAKYFIDTKLMDEYLKKRLKYFSILFFASGLISFSVILLSLYFQFFFSIGISLFIFIFFAIKLFLENLWNDKFKSLANYEFVITQDSISQQIEKFTVREIHFSNIAVIHKKRFETIIVKGNWLKKLFYFLPKRNYPNDFNTPNLIFIPNITTNYSELIETIQAKKNSI